MTEPDLRAATAALRSRGRPRPRVHLVLGSGLGGLADAVENPLHLGFHELGGLPPATVAGHAGRFILGRLEGLPVLVQAGRYHLYEGHPPAVVAAPVRIGAALGADAVILTNAAGGIARTLDPGSLLLIDDHLDLQPGSPLEGPVREGEERFPDMSAPYDPGLQRLTLEAAARERIRLPRGVYAAMEGPSFETPAEIRMLEAMGAHAVGMSTVPEAICARALGVPVLAVSLITNRAAGRGPEPPSHEEVREVARRARPRMEALVRGVLRGIDA